MWYGWSVVPAWKVGLDGFSCKLEGAGFAFHIEYEPFFGDRVLVCEHYLLRRRGNNSNASSCFLDAHGFISLLSDSSLRCRLLRNHQRWQSFHIVRVVWLCLMGVVQDQSHASQTDENWVDEAIASPLENTCL